MLRDWLALAELKQSNSLSFENFLLPLQGSSWGKDFVGHILCPENLDPSQLCALGQPELSMGTILQDPTQPRGFSVPKPSLKAERSRIFGHLPTLTNNPKIKLIVSQRSQELHTQDEKTGSLTEKWALPNWSIDFTYHIFNTNCPSYLWLKKNVMFCLY